MRIGSYNLRIILVYEKQFSASIYPTKLNDDTKQYNCTIWVSNPDPKSRKMSKLTLDNDKFTNLFEAKTFVMSVIDKYILENYADLEEQNG